MSVPSGHKSSEPFAYFDHDSSCWKMFQLSFDLPSSAESLPDWPRSGMTSGGHAYELEMSVPPIVGNACSSSLPTPRATDGTKGGPNQRGFVGGSDAAVGGDESLALLPTPAACRSGNNQSPSPGAAVRPSLDSITELLPTPRRSDGDGGANPLSRAERMDDVETRVIRLLQTPSTADGDGSRKARGGNRSDERLLPGQAVEMAQRWGKYGPAIGRWESVAGPAPSPTEPNRNGKPRLNPAFSEWMMGWPAGHVTAVPGISRNDQLRIIGNGVVPQQAEAALRWLLNITEVAA